MRFDIRDLWTTQGVIDRGRYAVLGFVLFGVKHGLDRVTAALFGQQWSVWSYWFPPAPPWVLPSGGDGWRFFLTLTLLIISLPFIWAGVALTLRRLRAARLPLSLVVLFFCPVINLFIFLLLSLLPSSADRSASKALHRPARIRILGLLPDGWAASAAVSVSLTSMAGVALTVLSTNWMGSYGWGLFVGFPFLLGMTSALLHSCRHPRSLTDCMNVSLISILLSGVLLLGVAVEGIVCLVMAAPIAIPLAMMGASVGYVIQRRRWYSNETSHIFGAILLFFPLVLFIEQGQMLEPSLLEVRTSVTIDACPADVWSNVIAFSELPVVDDWVLRTGIAYPVRAEISGSGPGAVRHCVFSTGAFVEPIEVWEEPFLLRFSVQDQPPTMQEWSPYADIRPPHLETSLRSRRGQFLLTPLENGRTHLEGTTWYENRMWPETYWRLWSDFIIHRIHLRVLNHIKNLAERENNQG